jgi:hypothetical protein
MNLTGPWFSFFPSFRLPDLSVDNPHCIRPFLQCELHIEHPLTNAKLQSYEQGARNFVSEALAAV